MQDINRELLVWLNWLLAHPMIENIVSIMADGPIFLLPLFLLFGWLFYAYKKQTGNKIKLLHIFYATVLWIIISLIIQQFVNIERPETAIAGTGKLILDHIPDASFPSDHATVSFAFLAGLYLWGYRRLFYVYLPLCIIMNLSRVIAWVHWPYDIIAWAFVWISSACIVFKYQGLIFLKKIDELILKISGFFKL